MVCVVFGCRFQSICQIPTNTLLNFLCELQFLSCLNKWLGLHFLCLKTQQCCSFVTNSICATVITDAVLSSYKVDLLRYSTEVDFFSIYFLRSRFLQTTFYLSQITFSCKYPLSTLLLFSKACRYLSRNQRINSLRIC